MMFNFSKYSFRGIQDLCREHHRQIVASPDKNNYLTAGVLDSSIL